MQYKFFVVPVDASEQVEEDLNKFLRSHRVLKTEQHFISEKGYWVMAVEYLDQNPIAEDLPSIAKRRPITPYQWDGEFDTRGFI